MAYGGGTIYKRGRIWWIGYQLRGVQQNESSGSTDRADAVKLLQRRQGEVESNRAVSRVRVLTVGELLDRLAEDYRERETRSLVDQLGKIEALKKRFRSVRAAEFGSEHIRRLRQSMRRDDYAPASVNRYMATLRRAFTLAAQQDPPLVGRVPHFPMAPEDNARQGFITDAEYRELLTWLPDHLKGLLIFGYHLGMRKTALKMLRRDWVDWDTKVIRTEAPGQAKRQGRVLPIYGDMVWWLDMQRAGWPETPSCRWIFHDAGGRIGDFRKSWATACKAAKVPGLLFHDLRRSAVRNMERAGIPRSQAMAITGHKTESVYKRYAIVAEGDIRAAAAKLERQMKGTETNETTAIPTATVV